MNLKPCRFLLVLVFAACAIARADFAHGDQLAAFHLVVMDPLAAPLSCPCVEGYAQRKYEALAKHLEAALGREVHLTFSETLEKALRENKGQADLIIGKDSVVRADAAKAALEVRAVAALTDKKGSTTQQGLIVVRDKDPARKTADLAGYDIIFGPAECDEKHAAAIALLRSAGVAIPEQLMIDEACSDGACKVIELDGRKIAAVISSYAAPLLEGCGTIKKGDLRVVGRTKPVPFVAAFVNQELPKDEQTAVRNSLLSIVGDPEVCEKLETLIGFVDPPKKK